MRTRQSFNLRLKPLHRQEQFRTGLAIVKRLRALGHETVLAGGCVRDGLLGVVPKDLDIATAAPPEVVEGAFARTLAVGKAFGTIVVIEDGINFEVTTFRREAHYTNGRHPEKVEFTDLEEDSSRRDFTVNALYYDPVASEVIDCVRGMEDLSAKRLRTVGKAEERFQEDYLRMLRAPRFVAQLGFELEDSVLRAIQSQHAAVAQVSAERVLAEMRRLLSSPFVVHGLETLRNAKLDGEIWPESRNANFERLGEFMPFLSWEHAFAAVTILAGEKMVEPRFKAWKASRESLRKVQLQIEGLDVLRAKDTSRADRARVLGGEEFAEVLQLARAFVSESEIKNWIQEFLEVSDSEGRLPKPYLNGQDLIEAGVEPGQRMGSLLKALYNEQLAGKLRSKTEALERLKTL